jgi:hypothetical protein
MNEWALWALAGLNLLVLVFLLLRSRVSPEAQAVLQRYFQQHGVQPM